MTSNKLECPKCRHPIKKGDKFCEDCGIPIQDLATDIKEEGGDEGEESR